MEIEIINVVSGLPRSGSSMLMSMLVEGGIEPLCDNIREPDEDNPRGYYEYERVKKLPEDTGWLKDARGKVVKVLAELILRLPQNYSYRIVFIQRDLDEMIASQRKMLIRRGKDPNKIPEQELRYLFNKSLKIIKNWLNKQPDMEVFYIRYNDILRNPMENIKKLNRFFGGTLDEQKMIAVVDERLYRNRAVDL